MLKHGKMLSLRGQNTSFFLHPKDPQSGEDSQLSLGHQFGCGVQLRNRGCAKQKKRGLVLACFDFVLFFFVFFCLGLLPSMFVLLLLLWVEWQMVGAPISCHCVCACLCLVCFALSFPFVRC